MNGKEPTYEELEKKLADAQALIARLQGEIEAVRSERDNALLGTRSLKEAYVESEQNFRNSLGACPLGVCIGTENGDLIYANQAALDIFGYSTVEEIKAVPLNQIYTPDCFALIQEKKEKKQRGEYVSPDYEMSIKRPEGEIRNLHVFRREVIWGGEQQYMAMYQDITERKRAEEALRQSEEMFARAFHTSPNLMLITTLQEGRIVETNEVYCRVSGYKREELIGRTTIELNIWNDPEQRRAITQKLEKEGQVNNIEMELRTKSGEIRSLVFSSARITLIEEPCLVTIASDITERKQAEEELHESERKLRALFEILPVGVSILDAERDITYLNPALERILDISREGLFKGDYKSRTYLKPDGTLMLAEEYASARAIKEQRAVHNVETGVMKEDGNVIWTNVSAVPVAFPDWKVVIVTSDITERKRAEEALRKSEENFRRSLDDSPLGIRIINPHDETIYANRALLDIFGYASVEELRSIPVEKRFTPDTYAEHQIRKKKRARGEYVPAQYEMRVMRKDGEIRHLEALRKEILWNGEIQYLVLYQDITERRKVEEALRKSEENFRRSLDDSPLGIRIINPHDETIYANRALLDIYGCASVEEFRSIPVEKRFTPESYKDYQIRHEKIARGEYVPMQCEMSIVRKDGEIRHLETLRKEILWNGETQYQVLHQDITERKQAEERINHLNITLRSVRNINQLVTREKNRDRLIKSVCNILVGSRSCYNAWIALFDESRKLVAWAESGLRGDFSPMLELFNQGKLPPCVQKAMKQKRMVVTEDPPTMCTGCPIVTDFPLSGVMTVRLEHEGNIYGVLCASMQKTLLSEKDETTLFKEAATDIAFALHDIALGAERDLLIQERLRTAKLESIGTLAGGIAHDFNNFLTGIMGNIGLAKTYLKPDDRIYEMVDEAEKAALRARDLTQQLLTFARGGKPVKKLVNIAERAKESAAFALRGSNVKLELSLPDDLWPVEADEGQISQVIQNLVINADEAMPAGGILKIEASNFAVKKTGVLPLARGNYVRIDIKDTGVGISEEHLQRIFEPYFTTKHKGSGLGLTTVYSIVKNHGGYILAESVINEGSAFHIYLPASKKTVKTEKKSVVTAPGRAGGKVLVMDDQESIRKMLRNILDLAGYETELTSNGAAALEKYAQALKSGKPFNAVIMDLTVPGGMGGKEAIKKLLKIDPDASVIVSSGYATDPIMSEYKKYGFSAVISKPYSVKQLEETLLGLSQRKEKPKS